MSSRHWLIAYGCIALSISSCNINSLKSPGEIAQQAKESVVLIYYQDKGGHGTGFVIPGNKETCNVLTVRHVVPPSEKLKLQTPDQKTWKTTDIKRFPQQDLALVTFKPDGGKCPYKALNLGDSDKVRLGDGVYIIGFPSSRRQQFVIGNVSSTDSQTDGYGISYSATTAGGMSGGPVMDTAGKVVAVHGRTDVELTRLAELKGEPPPPQQQSTKSSQPQIGDAVGTFKWGIPINAYRNNVAKVPTESERAVDFLNQGDDFSASKSYKKAIAAYEKALERKPDLEKAWYGKGFALDELKRYEDAIVAYDKAVQFKPDYHQAWYNRGIALRKLKRYKEAIVSYDRAIAIKPDYHQAWYNRGNALRKLKRYEDAIASYDKAIAIKPDYDYAWHNRGSTLDDLKRYEDAIASYDKAIAIKPDDHETWYNRGNSLRKLKRYEEAIASYDKAIAIKPDYDYAWNNRGFALEQLKRYEQALESYNKAIKFNPKNETVINNRQNLLTKLGRSN
ncbi:MAG: tetratricopeptide repeat-containing serine protease family protein [Calothrix sp. MO_192.B10]|nr:tetratricopeptide repeat-containing serine protease family protein [Calothrix sp. MO_192.B10]